MDIPSDYAPGYERALAVNPDLARRYVEHTLKGDPDADALIEGLHGLGGGVGRLIGAGMERDEAALRGAPACVRDFFEKAEVRPELGRPRWLYAGHPTVPQER